LKQVDEGQRAAVYQAAKAAGEADAADSTAYLKALGKRHIVENLATLIDNQPQFSVTLSRRDLGQFSGPDESAVSLDLQIGRINLNSIKGNCEKEFAVCLASVLDKKEKLASSGSDKFVLTASYRRFDRYHVIDLGDVEVDGFMPIDLARASEWKGKLQWGRKLGFQIQNERPRLDISGEYSSRTEASKNTLNRIVATATLTVPYSKGLNFPVSLTYANKPEFLSEQRKDLSVHVGLSYRLPWEGTAAAQK
jgi:hypothetical protein